MFCPHILGQFIPAGAALFFSSRPAHLCGPGLRGTRIFVRPSPEEDPHIRAARPPKSKKKPSAKADGFLFQKFGAQASLFSLMVMALFLLAALFRCSRPLAAALSMAFTVAL